MKFIKIVEGNHFFNSDETDLQFFERIEAIRMHALVLQVAVN